MIHHCGSEQVATLEQERELPNGSNSFFRQLDYMVATVSNEEFQALYRIEDTALYAKLKDAIFSRYRTFAEIIGLLLVRFGVYSSASFYQIIIITIHSFILKPSFLSNSTSFINISYIPHSLH